MGNKALNDIPPGKEKKTPMQGLDDLVDYLADEYENAGEDEDGPALVVSRSTNDKGLIELVYAVARLAPGFRGLSRTPTGIQYADSPTFAQASQPPSRPIGGAIVRQITPLIWVVICRSNLLHTP